MEVTLSFVCLVDDGRHFNEIMCLYVENSTGVVLSQWLLTIVTATAIMMGVIIVICTEYSLHVLLISLLHEGEAVTGQQDVKSGEH